MYPSVVAYNSIPFFGLKKKKGTEFPLLFVRNKVDPSVSFDESYIFLDNLRVFSRTFDSVRI